ncbi:RNA recognition motif-containing protein RRM [Heterostelium album PN500]|uniref:RNA recognition motif-containing protein RRM n=1 Tax=Heterostelium pallidum (strain ATCC 26659 / Pp 5 / PN500) TaxID=670386 RepID=D3BGV0_HETP5|nr:RNA recognition motif-containing protein RRM [Heterostelium album PN500]EFA79334.1 RNA recognition motif-containing protein RRM [Heterostelium album PN500]|eukprot:XP_020431455.1 RNA recognition motif-containing protein RRM [Heterostelium album PN500]
MSSFDFRFWKKQSSPGGGGNASPNADIENQDNRPLLSSSVPTYSTFNDDDLPLRPPANTDDDSSDEDMSRVDISRFDSTSPMDDSGNSSSNRRESPQSSTVNILDEPPSTWRNFVSRLRTIQKKEVQHQLNVSRGVESPSSLLQASSSDTSSISPIGSMSPSEQSPMIQSANGLYNSYQNPAGLSPLSSSSALPMEMSQPGLNVSQQRRHRHQHREKLETEQPTSTKDLVIKTIKHNIKTAQKRAPYYIPILSWLPKYDKSNLSGDIIAGITTAIMLIPQGMAYAFLVGIPSIHGLYTGLIPVLVYCFFGTSRQLSVGPEAAVSLIVGTTLKQISDENDVPLTTPELIDLAIMLSFIVGIFSLALGLLRFGFLSEVLSRPLIRGFILAIAVTILLDQMDTLLGLTGVTGSGWRKVVPIFKSIHTAKPIAYCMSIGAITSLFIMNKLKRMIPEKRTKIIHHIGFFIPSILVVVVIGISVTSIFKLGDKGLAVLGYTEIRRKRQSRCKITAGWIRYFHYHLVHLSLLDACVPTSAKIGLIVSIGMSCFMVIKQSSAPHFSVLGRMPESTKYKDITLFTEARQVDSLIIIRFDESIYFSNVGQVKEILFRIEKLGSAMAHPSEAEGGQTPLKGVVFDMRNIPVIDASSIQILHEIVSNYEKRDIIVTFVKLKDSLKTMFLRGGFYDLIGTDRFYTSIHEAVIRILGGPPRTHSSYFTTQILVPNEQQIAENQPSAILLTDDNTNSPINNYSDSRLNGTPKEHHQSSMDIESGSKIANVADPLILIN